MALHWLHYFHTDTAGRRHYRLQMIFSNIFISRSVRGKYCIDSDHFHSILYSPWLLFFTSLHTYAADSTRDGQEETSYHFICKYNKIVGPFATVRRNGEEWWCGECKKEMENIL